MRAFTWMCNVLIFGCLCCLILLKAYAAYALFIFLAVSLILIVGTLVNKVYWKGWYVGYDYEDAFYTGDVKRWSRALRQKCLRCFSSRTKREKVQPVIGANSSSSNDEAAAYKVDDDSDELSSTSEEYSEAERVARKRAMSQLALRRRKEPATRRPASGTPDSGESGNAAGRGAGGDSAGGLKGSGRQDDKGSNKGDTISDNEELYDDRYLPRCDDKIDPFLAREAKQQLRKRARHGDSFAKVAGLLSDVACRGRIRPPECRAVIVKHAARLTELRFRTSEIIEDLDRA